MENLAISREWYHLPALMTFIKRTIPLLLLLVAFGLRTWQLTEVPPGLTHDEAAHGHDAAHILKGVTPIYFTIGYGREPLFDYLNAGLIAGMGASLFTLRFSAAIWGLITLAATYRLTRMLFNWETATLALALMTVTFWPLVTGRQILRSDMLPAEMAVAGLLFVKSLNTRNVISKWLLVIGLGLILAASLYTYIPARVLWLIFPLTIVAHTLLSKTFNQSPITNYKLLITNSLIAIAIAFLLASPLFVYLYQNPEAELRIGTLSGPLTALQGGDPSIVFNNAKEFLLAFVLPGHGDSFLAYTIPGKPIFDPVTFVFFVVGIVLLVVALFRRNVLQGSSVPMTLTGPLLLGWLALGIAPSLVTGPEALTTRVIGAQPVLYMIPAVGLAATITWGGERLKLLLPGGLSKPKQNPKPVKLRWDFGILGFGICSLFIVSLFIFTARDYFVTWGNSPEVRAAYQSTTIEMLKTVKGPTVISTVYPAAPHDPYIGELFTTQDTRWVDARLAVILRPFENGAEPYQLMVPASTPLHPFLATFFQQRVKMTVRADDLDPYFILYQPIPFHETDDAREKPVLNDAVELQGSGWLAEAYKPGDVAEFFTGWHVLDPNKVAPIHAPTFETDVNLFTHVLNADGTIYLQQDRLDAPSWDWQAGDTILQVHQFSIPSDAAPGQYSVEVGLYDRVTGERLTTADGADQIVVAPLIIQ